MTALAAVGVVLLLIGAAFYWLNTNAPVQTCIPAVTIPAGLVLLIFAAGLWLGGSN